MAARGRSAFVVRRRDQVSALPARSGESDGPSRGTGKRERNREDGWEVAVESRRVPREMGMACSGDCSGLSTTSGER
jgi:hypothetical protein